MAIEKRGKGRPKGSGMKNDEPHLRRVADMMTADETLAHTTAMKRLMASMTLRPGEMEETILRRWQGRWKVHGGRHLAAAQRRRAAVESAAKPITPIRITMPAISIPAFNMPTIDIPTFDLSAFKAIAEQARAMTESPGFQAAQDLINSPGYREMVEFASSPAARRLADAAAQMVEEVRRAMPADLFLDLHGLSPNR